MIAAPLPADEAARLTALRGHAILDTDPELGFDDLTALAASICDTPIALVSLVDAQRQWFKSRYGIDARETPREMAFCAHAILQSDILVVPDATLDPRFHDNPLATGAPCVRFYAGAPLIDPKGFALGTLCVIDHVARDLSARQLEQLARLGRQVICQLELRRARDEARSAAVAKDAFLASMSHEIRTPLNGVLGMAEVLSGMPKPAAQQELIEIIQSSGNHLLGVVDDILEFSRLEAGKVELVTTALDLGALATEVLAMTADAGRRKGLTVSVELHTAAVHRRGDPQRLRQMMLNLVGNAVKFTDAGSVVLRITDTGQSDEILLEVLDTGIGIAPETLSKLFTHFSQADSSTTRRYGGTGLGLAIVKHLATLMGGSAGAESEPGRGSRFWVCAPMPVCAPGGSAATATLGPPLPNTAELDLRGRTILVVDDEPINRLLVARMLQGTQCALATAASGEDALNQCRERAFDAVLLDCMMPVMDGYQTARQLRHLPAAWVAAVPIIALTANALPGDRERSLGAGMTDHIAKPFSKGTLTAALALALTAETLRTRVG